jgi:hypothetical protein
MLLHSDPDSSDDDLLVARYERAELGGAPDFWAFLKGLIQGMSSGVDALAALAPAAVTVGVLWLAPQIVARSWHAGFDAHYQPHDVTVTYFPEALIAPGSPTDEEPYVAVATTNAKNMAVGGLPKSKSRPPARERDSPIGTLPEPLTGESRSGPVAPIGSAPMPPTTLSVGEPSSQP